MLGAGEQLRTLTITVQQLLECSAKDVREWDGVLHKGLGTHTIAALALFPKDGDVVCPCSSIVVTVRRRKCGNSDSSSSRVLGPLCVSSRLGVNTILINQCMSIVNLRIPRRARRRDEPRSQRSLALSETPGKMGPGAFY